MSKQEEVSNGPRTGLWEKTTKDLCVCQCDAHTRELIITAAQTHTVVHQFK